MVGVSRRPNVRLTMRNMTILLILITVFGILNAVVALTAKDAENQTLLKEKKDIKMPDYGKTIYWKGY